MQWCRDLCWGWGGGSGCSQYHLTGDIMDKAASEGGEKEWGGGGDHCRPSQCNPSRASITDFYLSLSHCLLCSVYRSQSTSSLSWWPRRPFLPASTVRQAWWVSVRARIRVRCSTIGPITSPRSWPSSARQRTSSTRRRWCTPWWSEAGQRIYRRPGLLVINIGKPKWNHPHSIVTNSFYCN